MPRLRSRLGKSGRRQQMHRTSSSLHRGLRLSRSPREPTSEQSSHRRQKWNPTASTLKGAPLNDQVIGFSITIQKTRPIIPLPLSAVRFWRQQKHKWKINPWSTNYLRVLLLFNKCCNGWISNAKRTLHTNCMITPFWKLLSSATHQQGGWKFWNRSNSSGSSPWKLNFWK